jgi:hypothetical protein
LEREQGKIEKNFPDLEPDLEKFKEKSPLPFFKLLNSKISHKR